MDHFSPSPCICSLYFSELPGPIPPPPPDPLIVILSKLVFAQWCFCSCLSLIVSLWCFDIKNAPVYKVGACLSWPRSHPTASGWSGASSANQTSKTGAGTQCSLQPCRSKPAAHWCSWMVLAERSHGAMQVSVLLAMRICSKNQTYLLSLWLITFLHS